MACPKSLGNPVRPRKVGRIVERLLFFFLGRKVPQKPVVVAERVETAVYHRLRKGTVEAGDVGSLIGVGEKHVLPQNHEGLHPSLAVGIRNLGPSVEEVVREVRFHALRVGYRPSEAGLRKHLRLQPVDLSDEDPQFPLTHRLRLAYEGRKGAETRPREPSCQAFRRNVHQPPHRRDDPESHGDLRRDQEEVLHVHLRRREGRKEGTPLRLHERPQDGQDRGASERIQGTHHRRRILGIRPLRCGRHQHPEMPRPREKEVHRHLQGPQRRAEGELIRLQGGPAHRY